MGVSDIIQGLIGQNTNPAGGFSPLSPPPQTGLGGFLQSAQNPAAMATQAPKHGLFGSGISPVAGIAGIIGDALRGARGMDPTFGPAIQRRNELQMQQQNAMDRFIAEQQWKAAHPDPTAEQQNWDAYINASPDRQRQIGEYRTMGAPRIYTDPGSGAQMMMGGSGGPVRANSPEDVAALPDGTPFIAPDGSIRTKHGGAGPVGPQTFRPGG